MLSWILGFALVCAGVAIGVAYGYRVALEQQTEANTYLRTQIAALMPRPPAGSTALAVAR